MSAELERRTGNGVWAEPARPSTRAQQARYQRVLVEAAVVLSSGGEEALQMKDLAERSGVALATLYRYFPSKQHVVLAILTNRYEEAQRRRRPELLEGTARERVMEYLLRSFRSQQRDHALTVALRRAVGRSGPGPFYAEMNDRLTQLYMAHLSAAVGELTEEESRVLPLVLGAADAATMHWLAGAISAARVRFQIMVATRLLDLPSEVINADRERSRPAKPGTPERPVLKQQKQPPPKQPPSKQPPPKQPPSKQPPPKQPPSKQTARKDPDARRR
jgi:TetR/AcrR family transcriptional regulator, cholesterol catabolism regulator